MLPTGELTLCRSLKILSTIHNNIIKHGDCFIPSVLVGPLNLMGGTGPQHSTYLLSEKTVKKSIKRNNTCRKSKRPENRVPVLTHDEVQVYCIFTLCQRPFRTTSSLPTTTRHTRSYAHFFKSETTLNHI